MVTNAPSLPQGYCLIHRLIRGGHCMARNRGKASIREISYAKPTPEEKDLISDAAIKGEPIVTAILGAAMIELELDTLLRQRFSKITDGTWATMVRENGPFSTFDQKITAAFAFRVLDEATRDNLKIVKNIRNAFAHAKTLIDFEHELVVGELKKIKVPGFRKKIHRTIQTGTGNPKVAYVLLCMVISTYLVTKYGIALKAQSKRVRKKIAKQEAQLSPLARAFVNSAHIQNKLMESNPQLSPQDRSSDPNASVPQGLLSGLLPYLEAQKDST
jgi:hypothetical protein